MKLKKIITASLVIWMSGIVFVFCCGITDVRAAEIDSCPLSKIGHCQKLKTADGRESFQSDEKSLDCCGFLSYLFDKTRKTSENQQPALTTPSAKLLSPKFHHAVYIAKNLKVYHSIIQNRSGTYLKNCVFRI